MSDTLRIKYVNVTGNPELNPRKTNKYDNPAGIDLFAAEDIRLNGNSVTGVRTGIAVEIPKEYYGQIFLPGGFSLESNVVPTAGVIDSDYRGEIIILLANVSQGPVDVVTKDRIAQMVLLPVPEVKLTKVEKLSETKRGSGKLGSSDH